MGGGARGLLATAGAVSPIGGARARGPTGSAVTPPPGAELFPCSTGNGSVMTGVDAGCGAPVDKYVFDRAILHYGQICLRVCPESSLARLTA